MQEIGEGPPIVFIPGGAVAGSSWVVLADVLKDDFRCNLVDRPGCGLSDPVPNSPPRSPAEVKCFAEDLAPGILDGLELDAAASVVGPFDPRDDLDAQLVTGGSTV